jgi:hypothetical protein
MVVYFLRSKRTLMLLQNASDEITNICDEMQRGGVFSFAASALKPGTIISCNNII